MAKLIVELAPSKKLVREVSPGKKFVIGRRKGCDLVIGDSRASRTHAVIAGKGGHYVIKDNGSSNGTAVNGAKIDDKVELSDGDQILIAGVTIVFRIDGEVAAAVKEAGEAVKRKMLADLDGGPLPELPGEKAASAAAELPDEEGIVDAAELEEVTPDSVTAELADELGEELEELPSEGDPADEAASAGAKTTVDSIAAELADELGEELEELTEELGDAVEELTTIEELEPAGGPYSPSSEPEAEDDSVAAELAQELGEELEELPADGEPAEENGDSDEEAEDDSAAAEPVEEPSDEVEELPADSELPEETHEPDGAPGPDAVAAALAEELGEELEELEELPPNEEPDGEAVEGDPEEREEFVPHGDLDETGSGDEIDVFAAMEGDDEAGAAAAAGAIGAAASAGAPSEEDIQEAIAPAKKVSKGSTKKAGKKAGKSSREAKAKGVSKRSSKGASRRSTRRDSLAAAVEAPASDAMMVKIISIAIMVICGIGVLFLAGKILSNRRTPGPPRVIRKEDPVVTALGDADRLINEGHKAMREKRPKDAVACYEKAYDAYDGASQKYSGKGYGFLEQKKADINGWLRDAKEQSFIEDMRKMRAGG